MAEPRDAGAQVLVITHAADLGGAELALLRVVDNLPAQARSRLVVACLAEGALAEELRRRGVRTEVISLRERTRAVSRHELVRPSTLAAGVTDAASVVLRLTRLARSGPGLVQSASMKAHVLSVVVALLSRRPLIWYLHDRLARDYLPRPVVAGLRMLSRVPRTVIVNSRATAATVPRDTVLIYPGFSPEQALTPELADQRRAPSPPVLTLLGRISPTKGQAEFVRAAARVHRLWPECRFRVVGSPMFGQHAYADGVRALADQLGVPVEWVGFSADPRAQIDGSTAVVHASPTPEPFGQVILEACIRGVPVIATDAGGAPEILGDDGLLVPPGDDESLARAMLEVLEDPTAAATRARRAYVRTLEEFSAQDTARQVMEVWEQLPRQRRPRPPRVSTTPAVRD